MGSGAPAEMRDDRFSNMMLTGGSQAHDFNFCELGLKAEFISIELYLASTPHLAALAERFTFGSESSSLAFHTSDSGILNFDIAAEAEPANFAIFDNHMQPISMRRADGFHQARIAESGTYVLVMSGEGEPVEVGFSLADPRDINRDGHISPIDALLVINGINFKSTAQAQLDTNWDGVVSAIDALTIINRLGDGLPVEPEFGTDAAGDTVSHTGLVAGFFAESKKEDADGIRRFDDQQTQLRYSRRLIGFKTKTTLGVPDATKRNPFLDLGTDRNPLEETLTIPSDDDVTVWPK
jgi:hypothetical protein